MLKELVRKKVKPARCIYGGPVKPIKQPEGSYPKYSYRVQFRRCDGKTETWPFLAFNTKLVEKQAANFAKLRTWEVVKIRKIGKVNWEDYRNRAGKLPWEK